MHRNDRGCLWRRLHYRSVECLATLANRSGWIPGETVRTDWYGMGCLPRHATSEVRHSELDERFNLANPVRPCPDTRQTVIEKDCCVKKIELGYRASICYHSFFRDGNKPRTNSRADSKSSPVLLRACVTTVGKLHIRSG